MIVKQLGVSNFRNLGRADSIELPGKGVLVAAAPNATGKTNFLESLAVLLRGKSWRARVDDCLAWEKDTFLLWGEVESDDGDTNKLAVRYHRPAKSLRIEEDGEPASLVSFYSRYPLVIFLPEDTFLMSRGPEQRRNFLNHILVTHPGYLSALVQYQKVLRQRNSILKKTNDEGEVEPWTELLVEHGQTLWRHRTSLVQYMDSRLEEMYESLTGEKRSLDVSLAAGVMDVEKYREYLDKILDKEMLFGHTLLGPHRDDVEVLTGGVPVDAALSRGQVRGLVIALKLIAHRYIKKITKEAPLLLLDDVLSELDEERQTALLEGLPDTQTILTCTTVPEALRGRDDVYLLDLRNVVDEEYQSSPEEASRHGSTSSPQDAQGEGATEEAGSDEVDEGGEEIVIGSDALLGGAEEAGEEVKIEHVAEKF